MAFNSWLVPFIKKEKIGFGGERSRTLIRNTKCVKESVRDVSGAYISYKLGVRI